MASDKRFEKIYSHGTVDCMEIWVDKKTGVNYIFHGSGYSGGLTPLLDREGKRAYDKIDCWYSEEVIDFSKAFDKGDGDNSVQGHYGGDYYLMHDTVRYLNGDKSSVSITSIEDSINSHLVCYAAEKSRKQKVVVDL